jgi:hypothetical protein
MQLNSPLTQINGVSLNEIIEFIRDLAEYHDHDDDSHKYNTECYVCTAENLYERLLKGKDNATEK